MSPDKFNKLLKLRKKLDILDNSLINLIKKRTGIIDQVLLLKVYKNQIVDNKRIKFILDQIRKKSIKRKLIQK